MKKTIQLIRLTVVSLWVLALFGCTTIHPRSDTLASFRKTFHTKLKGYERANTPMPSPPGDIFQLVEYESPAHNGKLGAYLSVPPRDNKKHPAIIWITGGDCNTVDDSIWAESADSNDQTACAYRKAGIVMMFPSLRGGSSNPGVKEGFCGEVEDILAAYSFLKKQAYVDPTHIYLGGHSSGGTLALLTAESSPEFRAVFSFGPISDIRSYKGLGLFDFIDYGNEDEVSIRSPGIWLSSIKTPTYIIEGTVDGNLPPLREMQAVCKNAMVHFVEVAGKDHFSTLAPINQKIAAQILQDAGPTPKFDI